MAVLVIGASGFLGKALVQRLVKQGVKVYALSRNPPDPEDNLVPIKGNILLTDLGIEDVPSDITDVYHLASIVRLGKDTDGSIWNTNVNGTKEVVNFCKKYDVKHLYYTSTAFLNGNNAYEISKVSSEEIVMKSGIEEITVFRPSIITGESEDNFYQGHYSQWALLIIKVHKRAEIVRRKIEGTLRLPIFEPVFRVNGSSDNHFNVVPVDAVAENMVKIKDTGIFWLTNPNPPTVGQMIEWISDFTLVKIRLIEERFNPTSVEKMFTRMTAAFQPYLYGQDFPSDIEKCSLVDKESISGSILRAFLSQET